MGERAGIDEALLAAVEETKAKLRRAAQLAAAGEPVVQGPAGAADGEDPGPGDEVPDP